MKKLFFLFIFIAMSFTFTCFANEWVFYGTSDSGAQLFYNSQLVSVLKDSHDGRSMISVWVAIQDPQTKFAHTYDYVAFKDNPNEYALLGEAYCNQRGQIIKTEIFKNVQWENTENANLMQFLYQQVKTLVTYK